MRGRFAHSDARDAEPDARPHASSVAYANPDSGADPIPDSGADPIPDARPQPER